MSRLLLFACVLFIASFDATGNEQGRTTNQPNRGDWVVVNPEHWIFQKTGMKAGDRVPGLAGWEYHGAPPAIPGLEIVAEGPAWVGGDTVQHCCARYIPTSWSRLLGSANHAQSPEANNCVKTVRTNIWRDPH